MIKKIFLMAVCSFSLQLLFAQKPSVINGQLKTDKPSKTPIKLFKVDNGRIYEIAQTLPAKEGRFGFAFYPEYEGLYVVGLGSEMSPNNKFNFYFKKGDNVNFEFDGWDYKLIGENTKENTLLYKWHQLTDSIYQKSVNFMHVFNSTYVDFFPQLEQTVKTAQNWLDDKKTGNATFDAYMPNIMKMDLALYAVNFLTTPRSAHPAVEEFSPYYLGLKSSEFSKNTALIYNHPWGNRTLSGLVSTNFRIQGGKYTPGMDVVAEYGKFIVNDTLKGDLVLRQAASVKDYNDFKELMDKYEGYILTDSQKLKQMAILTPLLKYKKGDDAYQFEYEDNHGKKVGLADLKGKVVLVDVWATWCGPCKAEIPYLKKLEEEMKGQDVQFVSISVDEQKDKKKWLNYIDTANLGGIQLFAGGWNHNDGITKYYNIKGIPRFMVFDKNGKIVSVDSPRPSNPALKEMLEEEAAR